MTDQCEYCKFRGDRNACDGTTCTVHSSWYVQNKKVQVTQLTTTLECVSRILKVALTRADCKNEGGSTATTRLAKDVPAGHRKVGDVLVDANGAAVEVFQKLGHSACTSCFYSRKDCWPVYDNNNLVGCGDGSFILKEVTL